MRRRPYVGGELHEFDPARVRKKRSTRAFTHTQSGCEVPCPPLLFAGNSVLVRASGHQPLVLLFAAPPPAERSAPGPAHVRDAAAQHAVPVPWPVPLRGREPRRCGVQATTDKEFRRRSRVASRNQLVTRHMAARCGTERSATADWGVPTMTWPGGTEGGVPGGFF